MIRQHQHEYCYLQQLMRVVRPIRQDRVQSWPNIKRMNYFANFCLTCLRIHAERADEPVEFVSDRFDDWSPGTRRQLIHSGEKFRRTLISLAFALSWRRAPAQARFFSVRVTISQLPALFWIATMVTRCLHDKQIARQLA